MKKDIYNIKINPPQPSSDDIAKHKDFDALLRQFQEAPAPAEPERKPRLVWLKYATAAAAVFLLLFLVRGFITGEKGMTQDEYFANQPLVNPPLENIKPTYVSKKINANQGGTYEYDNGSKLIVPAAAFVNAKGSLVEGDVDIKFREMHDYVDFFLSGIPMTYDSAGTQYVLESAGMVEIYAEQNGQRLDMKPGKEIKVELISFVDMPRLNVSPPKYNIYKLDEKNRNWEYRNIDNIQFAEEMGNGGIGARSQIMDTIFIMDALGNSTTEIDEIKTLEFPTLTFEDEFNEKIDQTSSDEFEEISRLESSIPKPSEPVRPQRANRNQLSFDIDISENASPAVIALGKKYQNIVWHLSPNQKAGFNKNALKVEWESMDLKSLNSQDFELTLINTSKTESVIVTPALSGDDFTKAISVFEKEMEDYREALNDRELQLEAKRNSILAKYAAQQEAAYQKYNSEVNKWRSENQDNPIANQMVRRKIVNRFVADEFGIWNCDRPIHPDDLQIEGNFVLDKDSKNLNEVAYLVNKNRNTIVRIYAKDGAKVNFDQKSDNLMWMVTKDNQLAVFRPDEFKRINEKKDKHTFMMKVEPEALKSEEDVRKILKFDEM